MKVLLLANANSIHTQRWAKGLAGRGIEIFIFSLSDVDAGVFDTTHNIEVYSFGFSEELTQKNEGGVSKLQYLKVLPALFKKIKAFRPDIIHVHYISGYGTLGALCGFHPLIMSVWGSDIFDFPRKSLFHRKLIEYNLKKADKILSTSHVMAKEIKLYTDKNIEVTPFGIDMEQFKPRDVKSLFDKNDIVIGTIKTLEEKYGIEYLVKAFKIVSDKYKNLPLKLLIVGGGSLESKLKQLTKNMHIENTTVFTGRVDYEEIPKYHNMLTVSVFPSVLDSESFGVAIIESSACGKPVIVSNVGGLPEVVEDGVTGIIVPPKNPEEIAKAIEKLIFDEKLRQNLGTQGKDRVKKLYNWDENIKQMIDVYENIVK